jgi:hypothetical protein
LDLSLDGSLLTVLASSSTQIQTVSVSIDLVWTFGDDLLTRQQAETVTAITKKTCLVLDHFLGGSQELLAKFESSVANFLKPKSNALRWSYPRHG